MTYIRQVREYCENNHKGTLIQENTVYSKKEVKKENQCRRKSTVTSLN